MRSAWQICLLAITTFLFSWIVGLGGTMLKTLVLQTIGPSSGAYLGSGVLIDILSTALGCWLAVLVMAKTGQLKSVDSTKRLASIVTFVLAVVSLLPFLFVTLLVGKLFLDTVSMVLLLGSLLTLIVMYVALDFFLARYAPNSQE